VGASLERWERLPLEGHRSPGVFHRPVKTILGHRTGRRVVRIDDIHTLVERDEKQPEHSANSRRSAPKPPGQFISDELAAETARFIEEVKDLARRRRTAEKERGLPPPPASRDQRSRRR
jgi:hypothetical protein